MKISVCVPTYNQAAYVEQAVRSAFEQSLPPFEIIVSDDCSTDQTAEVLERLSAELPTLRVLRQPRNLGISRNTDACLRLAQGELVVRLDSDDVLLPDYLEKLSQQLIAHPDAGYAHAAVQEIDSEGRARQLRRLARPSGLQAADVALRAASSGYRVAANIIMFRREALEAAGYIAAQADFAEDYLLSASIADKGFGNVYLDETLSCYRVWLDRGQVRQRRKLAEIVGVRNVFEQVLEPAFARRHWPLQQLSRRRSTLACEHSGCLGWSIYSADEKQELAAELRRLSASAKARLFAWLYLNRLGPGVDLYRHVQYRLRQSLRSLYFKLRSPSVLPR